MGSWGHKPLENDSAQDLLADFNDVGNIGVLEQALDVIIGLREDEHLEALDAEEAIAAAQIIHDLTDDKIKPEEKQKFLKKVDQALKRILDNSELKELWAEVPEYDDWVKIVETLLSK